MGERIEATEVRIVDVMGVRKLAMEPGKVTLIRGANGSGKSSILSALQTAIGGGNLARLARIDPDGEEVSPEVVLTLEGDGERYLVEKHPGSTRVRRQVGDTAGFEDVPKPQAFLSALADSRGWNPVSFLNAPEREQALMLLEALPLAFRRKELEEEMGVKVAEFGAVPTGLHALEELALIRDLIFRERTGVNRDHDGKRKAAEQTRRNAPAVVPDGHAAQIAALELQVEAGTAEVAKLRAEAQADRDKASERTDAAFKGDGTAVRTVYTQTVRDKRAKAEAEAERRRADLERELAEAARVVEAECQEIKAGAEEKLDRIEETRAERYRVITETYRRAQGTIESRRATVEGDRETLIDLKARAEGAAKAQALHEQAEKFDGEADVLGARSEALTAALERLDNFRRRLASDLPIEGLEVSGKAVTVHGVPLSQLNTAQQLRLGVDVAVLRAKGWPLRVVWVDRAETLDAAHFEVLVEALKAADVQAFVASVTDGALEVASA